MKFTKYILFLLLLVATQMTAMALPELNNENNGRLRTAEYTKYVYNKINFKKYNKLSYAAFDKAFYGYLNLKEAGKVSGNALLTICDFTLSSNTKRLWVIDVQKKKVIHNTLVAHGMGSGEEYATKFSNIENSHQSSLGFYITGEIYQGDNGYSMKLHGVDGMFNSNAFERAIVVHGADYVSNEFARDNERIGRSHGCPALPRELTESIINKINNGNVLFIYHDSREYFKKSYWLTNPISRLPAEADMLNFVTKEAYEIKTDNNTSRVIENNNTEPTNKVIETKTSTNTKVEPTTPIVREIPKARKIVMIYESYDSRGNMTVDTVFAQEAVKPDIINKQSNIVESKKSEAKTIQPHEAIKQN